MTLLLQRLISDPTVEDQTNPEWRTSVSDLVDMDAQPEVLGRTTP